MYSLLIVDDEIHVVKGVQADLNLKGLQISEVYTAFNIRQAKEVFQSHSVDIMLCDIEMPQGTGLELLEWVKEHSKGTETIFLTSHADFKYAKQALQLGIVDYLLKPVPDEELEKVIEKAKDKINKVSAHNRIEKLWSHHHPVFIERFWLDVLHQTIPSNPSAIASALDERNLPITESMQFLPVLVSVHRWRKELSVRDKKIMEYALRNTAEEMIADKGLQGQILAVEQDVLLIIIPYEREEVEYGEQLFRKCEAYIESCNQFFYCDLSCYIGNLVSIPEMSNALVQLRGFERNNVAYENKVFLLTGSISSGGAEAELPDMSTWSILLRQGMKDKVVQEAAAYLNERIAANQLNAGLLQQFHQSFLQMIYFLLQSKGKQAHQLFCDSESMELSRSASRSVTDMARWIRHTVTKTVENKETAGQPKQVVDTVKQFIAAHLDQAELSREEIAGHAFLNPDYLARMFKKETGMSVMDYLFQERMKLAGELLIGSDMSVGTIAVTVGYSHFSHFSKMFKKQTGMNPNEYRLFNRESAGSAAPDKSK